MYPDCTSVTTGGPALFRSHPDGIVRPDSAERREKEGGKGEGREREMAGERESHASQGLSVRVTRHKPEEVSVIMEQNACEHATYAVLC